MNYPSKRGRERGDGREEEGVEEETAETTKMQARVLTRALKYTSRASSLSRLANFH